MPLSYSFVIIFHFRPMEVLLENVSQAMYSNHDDDDPAYVIDEAWHLERCFCCEYQRNNVMWQIVARLDCCNGKWAKYVIFLLSITFWTRWGLLNRASRLMQHLIMPFIEITNVAASFPKGWIKYYSIHEAIIYRKSLYLIIWCFDKYSSTFLSVTYSHKNVLIVLHNYLFIAAKWTNGTSYYLHHLINL